MAKTSLIQRELKREQLVAKYKKKYDELKGIANDAKKAAPKAKPEPAAKTPKPGQAPEPKTPPKQAA